MSIARAISGAGEVAPLGIRVLIVEPGSFRTGLLSRSLRAAPRLDAYASPLRLARGADPAEVTRAKHGRLR